MCQIEGCGDNSIQFKSVQFSALLLMCWHNSHKATNRDSTISFQRKTRRNVQNISKLITDIIPELKLNLSGKSIKKFKSLIEMEFLLNMSLPLPVTFAAKAYLAEVQINNNDNNNYYYSIIYC